ncbi:MAG: HAD hydrolase-like protein, partial [Deltaproteobacteria bacterium]
QVAMIGDDIEGDVRAAQALGMRGILVRTGKFRAADLERDVAPDAVLDSFADLPSWWEKSGAG